MSWFVTYHITLDSYESTCEFVNVRKHVFVVEDQKLVIFFKFFPHRAASMCLVLIGQVDEWTGQPLHM